MEEEIQQYLRFHPLSSRSELMEGVNTKVSVATFKRLLAAMISAGSIEVIEKPSRIKVTSDQSIATLTAKYSDIDINGHVNSIRYIEHILDLFPIELYKTKRIRRFEMAYVAESYFGDELSFFCDEVNANEFHVEVKKNGNEVVCRSKVIFE